MAQVDRVAADRAETQAVLPEAVAEDRMGATAQEVAEEQAGSAKAQPHELSAIRMATYSQAEAVEADMDPAVLAVLVAVVQADAPTEV